MTKKRFTQKDEDDWEILDRNKHFAYAHSGYQAEKIIQELNELVETNRELYKDNKQLKEENEQLKQQLRDKEVEWLRNNTVWEQMPTSKPAVTKTTLSDDFNQSNCITVQKSIISDLKKENEQLKSDLDYFKAKNGSLETGMFNLGRENGQLKGSLNFCTKNVKRLHNDKKELINENEQLKQQIKQLQHWNKCLAEKRHQELSYRPYTASKSEKELKELLEPKLFNCSEM